MDVSAVESKNNNIEHLMTVHRIMRKCEMVYRQEKKNADQPIFNGSFGWMAGLIYMSILVHNTAGRTSGNLLLSSSSSPLMSERFTASYFCATNMLALILFFAVASIESR